MAFWTTLDKFHQNRTIKPKYARTQATPQAVKLADGYTGANDIFPGSVLTRAGGYEIGIVNLCDAEKTPAGLAGTWVANTYGINELELTGSHDMAMWVLNKDAIFEIQNPAHGVATLNTVGPIDGTANWATAKTNVEAGTDVYLCSNAKGQLTIQTAGEGATLPNNLTVCKLISVEATAPVTVITVAGL